MAATANLIEPFPATAPAVNRVTICHTTKSKTCSADAVWKRLSSEIERFKLPVAVEPAKCGCSGSCINGVYLSFPSLGVFYHKVKEGHVPTLLRETLWQGRLVFPLLRLNPLQSLRPDLVWEKASGCLMALDTSQCMVQVAQYLIKFHYDESCGKCAPCRLGIQRLADLIDGVACGKAPSDALSEMQSLIVLMQQAPYCSFAGKVAHLILAVLAHFKEEFEAHIQGRTCPAGACTFSE